MKAKWQELNGLIVTSNKILFHGSNNAMIDYGTDEIHANLKQKYLELAKKTFDSEEVCEKGAILINQMDLFGGEDKKNLYYITQVKDKHFVKLDTLIQSSNDIFVLIGPELRAKSKWVQQWSGNKDCVVISTYDNDYNYLGASIVKIMSDYGYEMSHQDGYKLAQHFNNNLEQLRGFCHLVCLYYAKDNMNELNYEHCHMLLHSEFESLVTSIIESALNGDIKDVIAKQQLLAGDDKIKIIRILFYNLHRLLKVVSAMERGLSFDEALFSLRPPVIFTQKAMIRQLVSRWNSAKLIKAINLLYEREVAIKYKTTLSYDLTRTMMNIAA